MNSMTDGLTNQSDHLPYVSVIIPTYHDWDRLQICLDSLDKQTYPKTMFEILVVNNDPSDTLPKCLVAPENCKLLVEAKPGSYAARNKALLSSHGEILAFTDSDCQPAPDWLTTAVNFFINNPNYDRIGGKISLYPKGKKANWAESYDMEFELQQDKVVATTQSAMTANMITKRKVFDSVGFFNDELLSLGDYEWGKRANNSGFRIKYLENCVVSHPARSSFKELVKKTKRMAGGRHHLITEKKELLVLIIRNFFPPFRAMIYNKISYKSALVIYYLKLITAIELLKVELGKEAVRD